MSQSNVQPQSSRDDVDRHPRPKGCQWKGEEVGTRRKHRKQCAHHSRCSREVQDARTHTCTCAHSHTCVHTHAHAHSEGPALPEQKGGSRAGMQGQDTAASGTHCLLSACAWGRTSRVSQTAQPRGHTRSSHCHSPCELCEEPPLTPIFHTASQLFYPWPWPQRITDDYLCRPELLIPLASKPSKPRLQTQRPASVCRACQ